MLRQIEKIKEDYLKYGFKYKLFVVDDIKTPLDELTDEKINILYERNTNYLNGKDTADDTKLLNIQALLILNDLKNYNRYRKIQKLKENICQKWIKEF